MPTQTLQSFKHIFRIHLLLTAVLAGSSAIADKSRVDLLAAGKHAWDSVDATWNIDHGEIVGATRIKNGAITDPAASSFLVSKTILGGDIVVSMDVTFETGRYLGVYLDFGQDTQTGIWLATGHALAEDAAANEVERAYIKTVEDSFWIVRATGELPVQPGVPLHLRFARKGDYYSIFDGDTLVVTYRKPGGYPAGPLQIRLTNASARIHRLEVESDRTD